MAYSISLNNLKNIIAVVTVLTTISCLVPESAQAIKLGFSGSPNGGFTFLDFTLDTDVRDSNEALNEGLFKEAIQEAKYTVCSGVIPHSSPDTCVVDREIYFLSADIQASLLTEADIENLFHGIGQIGEVKYEATLISNVDNFSLNFIFAVPPNGSDLLNDLSGLSAFTNTSVFTIIRGGGGLALGITPITEVPEPDVTGSLLGVGALGAVSLLKGVKRSIKLQISQNSAVETQQVV